jgi:hypothetical protein
MRACKLSFATRRKTERMHAEAEVGNFPISVPSWGFGGTNADSSRWNGRGPRFAQDLKICPYFERRTEPSRFLNFFTVHSKCQSLLKSIA